MLAASHDSCAICLAPKGNCAIALAPVESAEDLHLDLEQGTRSTESRSTLCISSGSKTTSSPDQLELRILPLSHPSADTSGDRSHCRPGWAVGRSKWPGGLSRSRCLRPSHRFGVQVGIAPIRIHQDLRAAEAAARCAVVAILKYVTGKRPQSLASTARESSSRKNSQVELS